MPGRTILPRSYSISPPVSGKEITAETYICKFYPFNSFPYVAVQYVFIFTPEFKTSRCLNLVSRIPNSIYPPKILRSISLTIRSGSIFMWFIFTLPYRKYAIRYQRIEMIIFLPSFVYQYTYLLKVWITLSGKSVVRIGIIWSA